MWQVESPTWPDRVVRAVQAHELVLVVGNGVSRLSGVPSWASLFQSQVVLDYLNDQGVRSPHGAAPSAQLLEIAELLAENRALWGSILAELAGSFANCEPNLVHRIISECLHPKRVVTTNFDNLLTRANINATYLHGTPDDPRSWVLSTSAYREGLSHATNVLKNCCGAGTVTLFVGYGHSEEDYDVASVLEDWQEHGLNLGGCYSLRAGSDGPLTTVRLRRLGVSEIPYPLPRNPTTSDRLTALGNALEHLAVAAGIPVPEQYAIEMEGRRSSLALRNRSTTVVLGLASSNTVSCPLRFPARTRESILAEVTHETGGPGYVVARVLAALGHTAALVTKLGDDLAGLQVEKDILDCFDGTIDCDYVDIGGTSTRTWTSYVLLDAENDANRVVIDEDRDLQEMIIDAAVMSRVCSDIQRHHPRLVYVDKFFRSAVNELLRSPGGTSLPERCIVIYESGSDGEWWTDHELERTVIAGAINLPIVSFRFTRDFLAKKCGGLAASAWLQLGGGRRQSYSEERATIAGLLSNKTLLATFADCVIAGARTWLRRSSPRVVIMTTHEEGCVWFSLDTMLWGTVGGVPVDAPVASLFAGDVFRGGFMSAILELEADGRDAFTEQGLTVACDLGNRVAAVKVAHRTLSGALAAMPAAAATWRAELHLGTGCDDPDEAGC